MSPRASIAGNENPEVRHFRRNLHSAPTARPLPPELEASALPFLVDPMTSSSTKTPFTRLR